VIPTFAYTYRSLNPDELKTYIAFLKTPAAKKFNKAIAKLFNEVLVKQSEDFGQLLVKNLQSGDAI
jgi:hypothetical protein